MRAQTLVDVVHDGRAFRIIKGHALFDQISGAQLLFKELVAVIGEGDVAGFLIQLVMLFCQRGDQRVNDLIHLGTVLRRTGDDQRRPRLVDQDAVNFIHNGKVMPALQHIRQARLHVVA